VKDKQIKEILNSYRIQCDMAWSGVVDKAHTQKEYNEALKRIQNTHILSVNKLIESALTTQKESFIKIIESKRQTTTEEPKSVQVKNCDELNLWLEHTGRNNYNFALDDIKAELERRG
jgi:hypothetical protein